MLWSLALDVVLVLVLIGALVNGWRAGLLRTAAGLLGLISGGIAAFFVMPWVTAIIPAPEWRATGAIAAAVVLLVLGSWAGAVVGRALRQGAHAAHLGPVDRTLGVLANGVVAALVIALVGSGVAAMGVPGISPTVAGSWVVRGLDSVTPAPARTALAEIRTAAVGQALPWLVDVLDGPTEAPELPAEVRSGELAEASASVVRITGVAYRCGANLSGSGFVVAPDRVVTNAHVVAGVDEPIVEAPGLAPVSGRVVAFDREQDLALIAVDGLDVPALPLAAGPGPGTELAVGGYPFGGPYELRPARAMSSGPLTISEGGTTSTRDVLTLAADVDHGNSGGPVLTTSGEVGGVIFARSESVDNVGFAITVTTLTPLAEQAPDLTEPVDSGSCEA